MAPRKLEISEAATQLKNLLHMGMLILQFILPIKNKLQNLTACQLPCHYSHYSIVGTPRKFEVKGFSYISLFYTSTDITTSQEVLLYPFDSLVSEFGGALGLFLGFSFLGLLDIIQTAFTAIMERLKI